jgi:glycosyltransferase 2 family protein
MHGPYGTHYKKMDILKRGILKRLPLLIGPLLLVYIFVRYIDVKEFAGIYVNASPLFLVLSWFFNTILMLGKVSRIYFFMKRSSVPVGFFSLARMYVHANFLGQISNFLVSDIVNAGVLMLQSEKKTRISNIFIFSRISDLCSVLLLFAVFLAVNHRIIAGYLEINYRPLFLFICATVLLLPIALFFRNGICLVLRDLREMLKDNAWQALLYAIFIYLFYSLSAICDAEALRLDTPKSYILLGYMIGSLITILPISIAGIGTREILFIFLLNLSHVSPERAVALSALGFLIIPYLSLLGIYVMSLIGIGYENRRNG